MAYADTIREEQATFTTAANLIDGLLVSKSSASASSSISTTSTTRSQITNLSVSVTVPANSIVRVDLGLSGSSNSTSLRSFFSVSEDSTTTASGTEMAYQPPTASTSGYAANLVLTHLFTPSAGAHTYRGLWLVESGATFYIRERYLYVTIFQKGA